MALIYNPDKPEGVDIKNFAFRGLEDICGWYYTVPAGNALRLRDDVVEGIIKQFPFTLEVDEEGTILKSYGTKKEGKKVVMKEIKDFEVKDKVPNLIEKKLHPEKYPEEEVTSKDYFGNGLEDDSDDGFKAPPSKFNK